MNLPARRPSSATARTWFHTSGASCHSSSSRGSGPASSPAGSTWPRAERSSWTTNITSLRVCRRPVDVLPQARGPSSTTAGNASSPACTWASTTLGEYQSGARPLRSTTVMYHFDAYPMHQIRDSWCAKNLRRWAGHTGSGTLHAPRGQGRIPMPLVAYPRVSARRAAGLPLHPVAGDVEGAVVGGRSPAHCDLAVAAGGGRVLVFAPRPPPAATGWCAPHSRHPRPMAMEVQRRHAYGRRELHHSGGHGVDMGEFVGDGAPAVGVDLELAPVSVEATNSLFSGDRAHLNACMPRWMSSNTNMTAVPSSLALLPASTAGKRRIASARIMTGKPRPLSMSVVVGTKWMFLSKLCRVLKSRAASSRTRASSTERMRWAITFRRAIKSRHVVARASSLESSGTLGER